MGKPPLTLPFAAALAGLMLVAAGGPARAQEDSAAVEKISKLNKKAVDEFENLNFDQARKILNDALDAISRAGLDNSQVAARTHVHLGVVLFAGLKQKDDALAEFKKALQIAPDVKLDKLLATPEIQEVFDQAVSEQKGAGSGGGDTGTTAAPAADVITHEPVTRAARGKSIQINMTLDSSVKAKKVALQFSADGSDDFGERDMQEESPGNWMGQIPASATQGAKVAYYIEVDGDDDQVIASKGSAKDPLVVVLRGPGGEAPAGGAKKKAAPPAEKPAEEGATWYLGLGLGGGFGWTTGTGEINPADKVSPAGFAAAKLGQISPEVGYFLSPDLVLSLQLRFQLVTGTTSFTGPGAGAAPSYALAGLARARWLFDDDDLHPFVGGVLGGGSIRHVASFPSVPACGSARNQTCVDSLKSGPIFVGGTAGVLYNLTPSFALTGETNALLGFTTFTFNLDINVGIAVEF
ncbi:MAG TPA: tetratricopeptide repeat protein [Polyangia bacterium]|nr:tetratricopeptide repeat protein [Polyangia bacterium]